MTPDSPAPSSDGPMLPPRHRPSLENITKDTTELDLWAFEDDLDLTDPPVPQVRSVSSRSVGGELPALRQHHVIKPREASQPLEKNSPTGGERIHMNVSKARQRSKPVAEVTNDLRAESEFDELEHWDERPGASQVSNPPDSLPPQVPASLEPEPELPLAPTAQPERPSTAIVDQRTAPTTTEAAAPDDSEFSPASRGNATPVSLRPKLRLTYLERIGLMLLLILLVVGGLATLVISIKRLPTEVQRANAADFPIKGSRITIESAESYWREPITDGSAPEIIRRGTKLLPVLELKVSEGSGALRVLFRNDERSVEGDAVTRTLHGPGRLVIPATAGFDDLGMHAAYRTGGSKPWTIEIYEAATETAVGSDFKKLFEINVSTDRR